MRYVISLAVGLSLLVVSGTAAHEGPQSWTEARTERAVARDASVRVSPQLRASLRADLLVLIPRFRTLENLAWDVGDQHAAARFHNIRYRYSTALKQVEGGLGITAAECDGMGLPIRGNRFRHLLCAVTSKRLEVPSLELVYGDPSALPTIVEGEPDRYGPYGARLFVHVLRGSSISYRQAE